MNHVINLVANDSYRQVYSMNSEVPSLNAVFRPPADTPSISVHSDAWIIGVKSSSHSLTIGGTHSDLWIIGSKSSSHSHTVSGTHSDAWIIVVKSSNHSHTAGGTHCSSYHVLFGQQLGNNGKVYTTTDMFFSLRYKSDLFNPVGSILINCHTYYLL